MQKFEQSKTSLLKAINEIFSSPIDLFDFFLQNSFSFIKILGIYLFLTLFAPLSKFLNNLILLKFFPENAPTILVEGVLLSFFVYVFFLLFILSLEQFIKNFSPKLKKKNVALISFLPFAASSVFWLLPKFFLITGLIFAFFVGVYNYYQGFKNVYELSNKQFFSFLFLIGIFIGILTFALLLGINLYRNL